MNDTNSLQGLFTSAANQGAGMSPTSTSILVNNLNATTTAGATGAAIDDLAGDEVTLFVFVLDETGSLAHLRDVIIRSYNDEIQALKGSKAADSILMSTWTFNESSRLLHGYLPLENVPLLSTANYDPAGLTAFYDAMLDAMTSVVAYGQTLRDAGIRTKVVIVGLTDGENNTGKHTTPSALAQVAADLLKQEYYTLALVAFDVDGISLAKDIGFPVENVMNESSDPSSIRRALGTISASVIRTSQTTIGANGSQSFFS